MGEFKESVGEVERVVKWTIALDLIGGLMQLFLIRASSDALMTVASVRTIHFWCTAQVACPHVLQKIFFIIARSAFCVFGTIPRLF